MNVSMIVEHLNCIGWQDDTADQSVVLYNDIDKIVKIISKHRDQYVHIPFAQKNKIRKVQALKPH